MNNENKYLERFKESRKEHKKDIDKLFRKGKKVRCCECLEKITRKSCGWRYGVCFCEGCFIKKVRHDYGEYDKVLKHLVIFG